MSHRQRSKRRYSGLERVRSAGTLVVGLDHNNLPFSTTYPEPAGLDYEIAKLVADQLDLSLRVYWAYSSHDSYPSKLASKGLCDVILGVMPDDRFGKRVLYSKPYYYASYQLIVAEGDDVSDSRQPPSDVPLAIENGVAVRGISGRPLRKYESLEAILKAVATGREQIGCVISTRGSWLAEKRYPGRIKFAGEIGTSNRFPICAAVRKSDEDLKTALNGAFQALAESGELAKVFARWHIPYSLSEKGANPP